MNKKQVQEWAANNDFVLVGKDELEYLRKCVEKLKKKDHMFRGTLFDENGKCIGFQG